MRGTAERKGCASARVCTSLYEGARACACARARVCVCV